MKTIKRLAGAFGVLALTISGALTLASPAQADDGHYPDAGWQVRQIGAGATDWSAATMSAIVDATTVDLTKPDGTTGTSIETGDLGLPVVVADVISVQYELIDGAAIDAGAVRLFYYDSAGADTLTAAPTAFVAADGSGTLAIRVAADATVGTLGLVYDASNAAAGTVRFSDLSVAGTPVLFTEPETPPTTEPTAEPTAEPSEGPTPGATASPEAQLPVTGTNLLVPALVIAAVFGIAGVAIYLAARRRPISFTSD